MVCAERINRPVIFSVDCSNVYCRPRCSCHGCLLRNLRQWEGMTCYEDSCYSPQIRLGGHDQSVRANNKGLIPNWLPTNSARPGASLRGTETKWRPRSFSSVTRFVSNTCQFLEFKLQNLNQVMIKNIDSTFQPQKLNQLKNMFFKMSVAQLMLTMLAAAS